MQRSAELRPGSTNKGAATVLATDPSLLLKRDQCRPYCGPAYTKPLGQCILGWQPLAWLHLFDEIGQSIANGVDKQWQTSNK
jgi:hypothetical protein